MHLQEEPGPIFSVSSDQVVVIINEVPPSLSLLYVEQTHLSQVLPVSSSPYRFGGLWLALLQPVHVFPKLVSSKLDTVLQTQ